MPAFKTKNIFLAFDMHGCPNQCKHCWLGKLPNKKISIEKVKETTEKFKNYMKKGEKELFFQNIDVFTWMREPHFGENYKELFELEQELSSTKKKEIFDLMSTWRICRDEEYTKWAKKIGVDKCQISFFGMDENTNYMVGRKNTFEENIKASNILIENKIAPRWQIFLTKNSIEDLSKLEKLIKSTKIEEKLNDIGVKFECFLQNPTPDGNAFDLEEIRITSDDIKKIPTYFLKKTKEYLNTENVFDHFGKTEKELINELKFDENSPNLSSDLCFYITGEMDVFTNFAELMPWWKLGNLEKESIEDIIEKFEKDKIFGLYMNNNVKISEMVEKYGEESEKIYKKSDLVLKLMRKYGEKEWEKFSF